MNTKIAKVIAFELGLIIAILTWLALPTLRDSEPHRTTQSQARPSDSFGTVSPIFKPRASRLYAANNSNGQTRNDLLAEEPAPVDQEDQQPVVTEREVNTFPANRYVVEESVPYDDNTTPYYYDNDDNGAPYYGNVTPYLGNSVPIIPEPVLDDPYYYDPYFQYPQPVQVIILSNSHSHSRGSRAISPGRGPRGRGMEAQRPPIRQHHMRPRGGNGSPVLVSNPPRQLPRGGVIAGRPTIAGRPSMLAQTSRPTQVRRAHWSP